MHFNISKFILCLWVGFAYALSSRQEQADQNTAVEVITRDVAIIGGGSTGTFAAIKLRDENRTVSIIEHKGRLGGQTETYTDPVTGTPIDYGVAFFHDLDIVHEYFIRFGVPLTYIPLSASTGGTTEYFDFTTGVRTNYSRSDSAAALEAYAAQLAKYPYLEEGFDLPDDVPEDLLLPFGEFASKYGIGDIVFSIFQVEQGYGDFLQLPTIYAMKLYGLSLVQELQAGNGVLGTLRGNNSEIYGLAEAELGSDVHLHSTVLNASRDVSSPTGHSTEILIQTPTGQKLIQAKKLLITIPPTLANLEPFDIDANERALFSQFHYDYFWTGLLNQTGIPVNVSVSNVDPSRQFWLPAMPAVYAFSVTHVPGLIDWKYSAPTNLSVDSVKRETIAALDRIRDGGQLNFTTSPDVEPSFVAFADHSPYAMRVDPEAIKTGFYQMLYDLQGYNNVFWTGAAWHTHDSGLLWRFTDKIVNQLLETL
ncbi:Amine oxidase [Lasiodiplodia theobromae]|uniref:Amine oxidase n=1 Tax=Lasiodiplodia theobromae TaxID=45133 RepID=UPI0015C3AD17|nr:Amine oxidase [Lasiodiplodia theobromae]KAF4545829.1 Amine oxidase [Lasiodiplodia theobromae]